MLKLAVFNQKGGVGKSSLTVNLSACIEKETKKRVLVMDCDSQCNTTMHLLNQIPDGTIEDILSYGRNVHECIHPVCIAHNNGKVMIPTNMDLLCCGKGIDDIDISDVYAYKNITDQLEDAYDYCVMDCPPQKMATAITSLCAANYILVPTWTETDEGIQGWNMVLDLVNMLRKSRANDTLEILGLVITRTKMHIRALDKHLAESYQEQFGDILFQQAIRDIQDINECYFFREPVCYYKPRSRATNDYISLTHEILDRIEIQNRKAGK